MTVTALLDAVAGWPAPAVLAVAAALLVVESGTPVGVLVPGTPIPLALGLWADVAGVPAAAAASAAAAGTVLGTYVAWWRGRFRVGRRGPAPVRRRLGAITGWFGSRGPAAAAAVLTGGHWVSGARSVVPWMAGRAGVPYRLAAPVLTLTGTAWAAALVLVGGRAGPCLAGRAGWVVPALIALILITLILRSLARRTGRPEPAAGSAGITGAAVGGPT